MIFYSPSAWPYYSTLFAALRSPDPASLAPFIPVLSALVSTNLGLDDEAVYGIRCSDKTFWAERIEDVLPGLRQRQRASYFGDNDANFVGCARWRFEARGRYDGDFKANTRKGVLVVGNTGDPATPLGNARVEWGRLAGSRVLEHGGFGVSSLSPSLSGLIWRRKNRLTKLAFDFCAGGEVHRARGEGVLG